MGTPQDTRGNSWQLPQHGLTFTTIAAGKELQIGDTIVHSTSDFLDVGGAIWKDITLVSNPGDETMGADYPTNGGLSVSTGSLNQTINKANPGSSSAPWSLTNNAGAPPAYIFVSMWAGNIDFGAALPPPPAPAPDVTIPGTVEFVGSASKSAGDPAGGGNVGFTVQTLKVGWYRTTDDLPRQVAGSFDGLLTSTAPGTGTPEHGFFGDFWVFADNGVQGSGLTNLATVSGYYNRGWIEDATVKVGRVRWLQPPFEITTDLPSGDSPSHPRLIEDLVNERLWCLWDEGGDVYRSSSDDDAETWSEPMALFEDASFPYAVLDPVSATILFAAYSDGKIIGRLQAPGDATPGDQFTFQTGGADLAVSEDSFSIVWHSDTSRRLILVVRKEGETDVSEWKSWDDGRTWTEVT
jgi:hypothetical protein